MINLNIKQQDIENQYQIIELANQANQHLFFC